MKIRQLFLDRRSSEKRKFAEGILVCCIIISSSLFILGVHTATGTPSLAIDGSAQAGCGHSTNSCSTTLSTSYVNDIVMVYTFEGLDLKTSCTFGVTDTAGLSWTLRASAAGRNDGSTNGYRDQIGEFWAKSNVALSSDIITESILGCASTQYGGEYNGLQVFGISGANYNSPFDPNTSMPGSANGYSNTPSVTISTSNSNDMVISAAQQTSYGTLTPGSGFTSVNSNTEYELANSPATNLHVTWGDSATYYWEQIADAVSPQSTAPASTTWSEYCGYTNDFLTSGTGATTTATSCQGSSYGWVYMPYVIETPGTCGSNCPLSQGSITAIMRGNTFYIPDQGQGSTTLDVSLAYDLPGFIEAMSESGCSNPPCSFARLNVFLYIIQNPGVSAESGTKVYSHTLLGDDLGLVQGCTQNGGYNCPDAIKQFGLGYTPSITGIQLAPGYTYAVELDFYANAGAYPGPDSCGTGICLYNNGLSCFYYGNGCSAVNSGPSPVTCPPGYQDYGQCYYTSWKSVQYTVYGPVQSTAALDGSAQAFCGQSTNSCSTQLSTSNPNGEDVIIAYAMESQDFQTSCTFSISDTWSMHWQSRGGIVFGNNGRDQLQEFWAINWAGPLSSDTITESISGCGGENNGLIVVAIGGANAWNPFDPDSVLPSQGSGQGTSTSVYVSTGNPLDFIISGVQHGGSSVPTPGSGFTIATSTGGAAAEGRLVSSTISNSPVTFGDSQSGYWEQIVDAVQ